MSRTVRLRRNLTILGLVGLVAYAIDSWAIANTRTYLSLMEFCVLLGWLGVIVAGAFRGNLRAGPDKEETASAMEMPSYQIFLALYLTVIAFVAVFVYDSESVWAYVKSPFRLWLVVMPPMAVAFALKSKTDSE